MLGVAAGIGQGGPVRTRHAPPAALAGGPVLDALDVSLRGRRAQSGLDPRGLVDPAIWSGPAIHVDAAGGDDTRSGLGAADGDFSDAVRTIYRAFEIGNATAAAYRVLVKPGEYSESAFSKNGQREPNQPVAILSWGGAFRYRTGPFSVSWSDAGATATTVLSSVRRAFRQDQTSGEGLARELLQVADAATCAATADSWCDAAGTVHVNIGQLPGPADIMLLRSFHGARFLTHASDLYLENVICEGGITGVLHCDAVAQRNIVAVNCAFRYTAPSNPATPYDAVRIRRTDGLCAFFDCDASGGAKDGWSFHEDGTLGMRVLLENCRGVENGNGPASSCNGFTSHDSVVSAVLGGRYGFSVNGTEIHCIQDTRTWCLGTTAIARDIDGTSVAFKCSNAGQMWLEHTRADAQGAGQALAVEANGGAVYTRRHRAIAGGESISNGGTISGF